MGVDLLLCATCDDWVPAKDFYEGENRCKICCVTRASRYNRLKRTGWSEEAYQTTLELQEGLCAICGELETLTYNGKIRQLQADHCHSTEQTRALICSRCNLLLGKVNDNPDLLRKAADYLEHWSSLVVES